MKPYRSMLCVSVLVAVLLWGWGAWHSAAQGTTPVSPDPVGAQLGTASKTTLSAVEPLSDTDVYTAYLPLALNAFGDSLNLEGTFFDDFSDPGSGWKVAGNDIAKAAYVDGEYELTVKDSSGYVVVTSPFGRFRDYVLEVDVYQVSEWAAYGLVFDYNDEDGYYVFTIVPDLDSYSISQFSYGSYDFIHSGYYPSAYQESPGAVNHLKVERQGKQLTFYLNDHQLHTMERQLVTAGVKVGLELGVGGPALPIISRFDNFRVAVP